MAHLDTRLKRQSATCMLVPSMLSGVYPATAGVVAAERAAVTWMYAGIELGLGAVTWTSGWYYNPFTDELDYYQNLAPTTAKDNGIARFDSVNGKLEGSEVLIDDSNNMDLPGNLTFTGSAGLSYGCCHGDHIGWTQASAVQNTWYNIADSDMMSGELNNVTHDGNGLLTIANAGVYLVSFTLSWEVNAANVHVEIGLEVDGDAPAADSPHVHAE